MKPTELLLVLVLLLAAGGLLFSFLASGNGETPADLPLAGPQEGTGEVESDQPEVDPEKGKAAAGPIAGTPGGPTRVQGGKADQGRAKLKRGVKGIVLDPGGTPMPDCQVYLAQSFDVGNFFQAMAMTRRMPVRDFRESVTDEQGTFQVGFLGDKLEADLLVTHPGYQTAVIKKVLVPRDSVRPLDEPIRLKPGLTVQGMVTSKLTGAPIAGATVRLTYQGTSVFDAVPGEEDGVVAMTDKGGQYSFTTLPPGNHNFEAYAKGHAKVAKFNQTVDSGTGPLLLNFSLPEGSSISGRVVDGEGTPLSGVKIEAISHSSKTPCTGNARSRRDGTFEILGLPAGAYRLSANKEGFVEGIKNMAQTGESKVGIVLQKKGSVIVRVLGRNGRPLRSFFLELRSFNESQPVHGRTAVPAKRVRNARGGIYEMSGIEPGQSYVFRVEHDNYAMAFSESFQVELGQAPPQVTVRMKEGGKISGRVVDSTGKPVAGAMVHSMNPAYKDNPFIAILGAMMPVSYSRMTAKTNRDGKFTLRKIMPQSYQIKITHPAYPKTYKKPIEVVEGQTTEVGEVILPVGVVVYGTAYDETGKPIPLAKVSMTSEGEKLQYGNETRSNEKGEFQFPPAPPGKYKLQCGRLAGGNPFMVLMDFKKSETVITVTGEQKRRKVDLQITPQ